MDATQVGGDVGRPPLEAIMHVAVYKRRADVMGIARGHPRHVAAYAAAGRLDPALDGLARIRARQADAIAALLTDLAARGLLDETLVVWGGEFGRTPMNEARNGSTFLGRDHHPRAFTVWLAGGGVAPGLTIGRTDELGYNVVEDPVDVHDLPATMLRLLGIDHEKLTYKFQGRDFRLTDVHGKVVTKLIA